MSAKFIYFMKPVGMDGPIKIGCTKFAKSRLYHMAIWSPIPLEIVATAPGTFDMEWGLHFHFAAERLHHEWFRASPRLVALVEAIKAGTPLTDLVAIKDAKARRDALKAARRMASPTPQALAS